MLLLHVYIWKILIKSANRSFVCFLDAPFILNTIKKLAIVENQEIYTECLVDAHPRADITWFGPSGQRLSSFTEEKILNSTVISSRLHRKC